MAKHKKSIDVLRAIDSAYTGNLNRKRELELSLEPAWMMGLLAAVTTLNVIWVVVVFILGLLVGRFWLLSRTIVDQYNEQSFKERNEAINLLTQSLMDNTKPLVYSLRRVQNNATGKLSEDFRELSTIVAKRKSNNEVIQGFENLAEEYADDPIFGIFIDQMETLGLEGRFDPETFMTLRDQHNAIWEQTKMFYDKRRVGHAYLIMSFFLAFGLAAATSGIGVAFSGFEGMMIYFWHGTLGAIACVFSVIAFSAVYFNFYRAYFNSDMMNL